MTGEKINEILVIGNITQSSIKYLIDNANTPVHVSFNNANGFSSNNISILVTRYSNVIDKNCLELLPNLKYIVQASTGKDNIDYKEVKKRRITTFFTEGESTISVAEYTIMSILNLRKELPVTSNNMKNNIWSKESYHGNDVINNFLGIVGFGRIGKRVALYANTLGFNIFAYDPYLDQELFDRYSVTRSASLEDLCSVSDIISFHVPLTEETKNLASSSFFKKMKLNSYLINTSRGEVVDENALLKALEERKIKGAALDVFNNEPHINNKLCEKSNVICTPHIAGVTQDSLRRVSDKSVDITLKLLVKLKNEKG